MIIDLKKLERSGKETSAFYFEYTPEENLSGIPDTEIAPPIKVTGEVTLTDTHSAYIEGEVVYTLTGACTRCLSQTEKEYSVDFGEQVVVDNPDGYSVVNDKVDLTKIVDDLVIMSLPTNFLCKDDCKGICLGCGANLNQEECKCKK